LHGDHHFETASKKAQSSPFWSRPQKFTDGVKRHLRAVAHPYGHDLSVAQSIIAQRTIAPATSSDSEPSPREAIDADVAPEVRPIQIPVKAVGIILLQLFITAGGIWFVFHGPQRGPQIVEALQMPTNAAGRRLNPVMAGGISRDPALANLLRIQGISLGWWRGGGIMMMGLARGSSAVTRCDCILP
jgi:hypothetical protein